MISGEEILIINPNRFELGRSAYLCASEKCITLAIKEKKIAKMLRVPVKATEKIIPQLQLYIPQFTLNIQGKEVLVKP